MRLRPCEAVMPSLGGRDSDSTTNIFTCWSARYADHQSRDIKWNFITHRKLWPHKASSTNRQLQWSNLLEITQHGQQTMNQTRCPNSSLGSYPQKICSPSLQTCEIHEQLVSWNRNYLAGKKTEVCDKSYCFKAEHLCIFPSATDYF